MLFVDLGCFVGAVNAPLASYSSRSAAEVCEAAVGSEVTAHHCCKVADAARITLVGLSRGPASRLVI